MTRLFITLLLVVALLQSAIITGRTAGDDTITYRIDERVTAEDEAYIREGIRLAQDYLLDTFGATVEGPVIVNARATSAPANLGEIAEASDGYIAYFTRSSGWYRSAPAYRMEVVVHEFVHVYQRDVLRGSQSDVPLWLIEGTAEYLGSHALAARGVIDPVDADAYRFWYIADASLDDLASYEGHGAFRQADARVYGLAYLGIAALVEMAGVEALGAFFEQVGRGEQWEDAFKAAFDISPRAFYLAFELDRLEFIEPANPPDAYQEIEPADSASPVRLTGFPDTVAAGEQLLMQARSEPDARCIVYLWGPELDLAHETTADGAANLFWLVTIPPETPAQTAELSVDCGSGPILAEISIGG